MPNPGSSAFAATVTMERLATWQKCLIENSFTPLILIGLGVEERSGQLLVLTVDGVNDATLVLFVEHTLELFRARMAHHA